MVRRLAVFLVAAVLALPFAAHAQAPAKLPYPVKVVTLVTHSSPGAGSDVVLRELVKYLEKYINATFIVENDEGGSGARAVSRVAESKPDGSMFYATTPTYILTSLLSQPPKTYRDLDPLVNLFTDSEIIYVRADSPVKSLKDLIARARATRGRWGAANPGSLEFQAAQQLKLAAKVNAAVVSHEGGGDLMINVLNGTLDMGVGEMAEIRAQYEAHKVRVLATFNPMRMAGLPDLPTVKESGYDVALVKFRGLAGPKGLPAAVLKTWDEAAKRILEDPDFVKTYGDQDLEAHYIPHAQYGPFIAKFAADTEVFLKSTGVIR
jgi:putative tricarboxylic transport membrane protein